MSDPPAVDVGTGSTLVRLGISTCPNDTYAFAALLENRIDVGDLRLRIELMDIDRLNDRLAAGTLDIAKASYHAALGLTDQVVALPVGSALGFGVGPLLLGRPGVNRHWVVGGDADGTDLRSPTRILTPGALTTATMLLRLFYAKQLASPQTDRKHVVFSSIMPALSAGDADYGVCIHEGRFTYQSVGLTLVEDLGQRWERETTLPLPLGGLFARRNLAAPTVELVIDLIRQSLRHANRNPATPLPTMRRYAAEFDDAVLMRHVELYVNDWTMDLGEVGRRSIGALSSLGRTAGLLPPAVADLEIL